MYFGLSTEQTLLQSNVNRFLEDNADLDKMRQIASGALTDREIWRGLSDLGIAGIVIDERLGGVGLSCLDAVVVAECLGYRATPAPFLGAMMASQALQGTVLEGLLEEVATGNRRVGIAFSEAIPSRTQGGLEFCDGRLNGQSAFAIDVDADTYLVATLEKQILLVAAEALAVQPIVTVDKTRSTATLSFSDSNAVLVSEDPDRFDRTLDLGRLMLAADSLGAAQFMVDSAVAYAMDREQFNRPIASFQAVKHMCAEMAAALEPSRSLVWYASHAFDHIQDEARIFTCHAKAHLAEVSKDVAKTATEVHGGIGFTDLLGLHYWFKRIGFNRQLLGSPEVVREDAARLQGMGETS